MCGIAGIFDLSSGAPVRESEVAAMLGAIAHRGPDASGSVAFAGGALGNVRLAVVDRRPESNQPFRIDGGRVLLTYNGEVYNAEELRSELASRGHAFRTRSDTEVVARAWREWGPAAVSRLNGMWAFALYDAERDALFCSRDRFGIKPFYYALHRGQLLFASEPKALLVARRELARPDTASLATFLRSNASAESETSFFEEIRQLPAAHHLHAERSGLRLERYWSYPTEPLDGIDANEAAEELRALLGDSVRLRLRGDVPVGVALSGGIDSATLAALARREAPGAITAFTAVYPGEPMDEGPAAARIAAHLGIGTQEVETDVGELPAAVERIVHHLDAPCGYPESVPLYRVMQAMRGRVGIALQGEGADELLGGYEWIDFPYVLLDRVRARDWRAAMGDLRSHVSLWGARTALEWTARALVPGVHDRYRSWRGDEAVYTGPLREPAAAPAHTEEGRHFADALTSRLHRSHTGMLRGLLQMADALSMAHSIELRVPFLDPRVVELGFRLPGSLKARGGQGKLVLRDAMRGELPPEVLEMRRKNAFETPFARWFRERPDDLLRPVLSDDRCRRRGWFDPERLEACIGAHVAGRVDLTRPLFRWLTTELWAETVLDGP